MFCLYPKRPGLRSKANKGGLKIAVPQVSPWGSLEPQKPYTPIWKKSQFLQVCLQPEVSSFFYSHKLWSIELFLVTQQFWRFQSFWALKNEVHGWFDLNPHVSSLLLGPLKVKHRNSTPETSQRPFIQSMYGTHKGVH